MNIKALIALTAIAERQVRFLIAEGFVPAPRGGRSNAEYGDDHVAAIRRYTRLHEIGFPPSAIRLLLKAGEGAPFVVAPGLTLVIDPQLIASSTDPGPLIEAVCSKLIELTQEASYGSHDEFNDP